MYLRRKWNSNTMYFSYYLTVRHISMKMEVIPNWVLFISQSCIWTSSKNNCQENLGLLSSSKKKKKTNFKGTMVPLKENHEPQYTMLNVEVKLKKCHWRGTSMALSLRQLCPNGQVPTAKVLSRTAPRCSNQPTVSVKTSDIPA